MKYRYAIALALAAIATSACSKNAEKPAQVFATVNGETITTKDFDSFVTAMTNGALTADKLTPEQRKMVTDRLIVMHVAAADAVKNGLEKQPDTEAELKMMRLNVLSSATIKKYIDGIKISDADVQAEYTTKYGTPKREFKAQHILVKTQEEADALIAKLKKGADFSELAKKNSIDPGSGKNGGELGWFAEGAMVPEFTAAVEHLEKGKFTETPVKTQFGYHIIKLEDTRDSSPPPLDQVKPQIENELKQKKVQEYIESLRKDAKVDIKETPAASTSSASSSTDSVKK